MLEDYPSKEAPLTELDAPHLPLETQSWLQEQLAARFCSGEVTLFAWIAWLQEQEHVWAPQPAAPLTEVLPASRRGCPISAEGTPSQLEALDQQPEVSVEYDHAFSPIMHGKPFTDRKSTFQVGNNVYQSSKCCFYYHMLASQAHLARVKSAAEVETVKRELLRNNKIQACTHRVESVDPVYEDYSSAEGNAQHHGVEDCSGQRRYGSGSIMKNYF